MHSTTADHVVPQQHRLNFAYGVWRLVDPKIATASIVPFIAGLSLAHDQGRRIAPLIALAAFAAIFLVEVGKNAINDLIDFRSGTDLAVRDDERSPYSGGKRVLVDQLLTEGDLKAIGWTAMLGAGLAGAWAAMATNPMLLILGAVAAGVAAAYSIAPLKLSYRGLGELAVFLTYGPGIVIGAVLLFGGTPTAEVLTAAASLGLLIANILLINEVPDERADRSAGKRTLVVRLGRARATQLFGLLFVVAFTLPVIGYFATGKIALLGLLGGAVPADFAAAQLAREPSKPPIEAQGMALFAYVIAGAMMSLLLWIG